MIVIRLGVSFAINKDVHILHYQNLKTILTMTLCGNMPEREGHFDLKDY